MGNHKKQIAIIDDQETTGMVRSLLGRDYDVISFENPIKTIEWLMGGNHLDLIISGIRMPKMTGNEFLSFMKSNQLYQDIPIIMSSSEESMSEHILFLKEGADDYILKPFNSIEFNKRIKQIIG